MTHSLRIPHFTFAAILVGLSLSACTSIGYRCPLDPSEKADSDTACMGMQDAVKGARQGTGANTSVFLDEKGRIIPRELLEQRAASPLARTGLNSEGGYPSVGKPVYEAPKVFQAWAAPFKDADGHLHDDHRAWFTTPGHWTRGESDTQSVVGSNIMKPATPGQLPQGRIVTVDPRTGKAPQPTAQPASAATPAAKKSADSSALNALAQAANSSAAKANKRVEQPTGAAGVTPPAAQLND